MNVLKKETSIAAGWSYFEVIFEISDHEEDEYMVLDPGFVNCPFIVTGNITK